jgi:hypothetical protein
VTIGGAASLLAGPAAARAMKDDLDRLGYEGLVYALPSYEMAATRARALAAGLAQNVFQHSRRLSTAKSRAVTAPNTDTLYSTAWLDISAPVEIALPRVGSRYFSLALMDIYTNNFEVLGGAERVGADRIRVSFGAPPPPKAGVREVSSPTRTVWALARTYTAGGDDIAAARAVQDMLAIAGPPKPESPAAPPPRVDIAALLQYANAAMTANPPPARDAAILRRLARVGIGPDRAFPPPGLSPDQVARVVAGARRALGDLQHDEVKPFEGWLYAKPDTGNFGVDYMNRARIALTGLAALPVSEAFYLKGAGDSGDQVYDGRQPHSILFKDGVLPPASGFWSITLYESTPEGQLFLFDNPQGRYSIGSNTGPLVPAADGSIEIAISARPPAEPALINNWLPAPEGPYRLEFRAFRPGPALVSRRYRVPPVRRSR